MKGFREILIERATGTPPIRSTRERAYDGTQAKTRRTHSKLETGAIGERIAMHHLRKTTGQATALNTERTNYPVDLATRHHLVEVKTGLASNNEKTHRWRATIGQPGKKETEWLKNASNDEKRDWNARKNKAIIARKNKAVQEHSKKHGVKMGGKTVGVILHPDKKVADVHEFEGFHHNINWKHPDTEKHYVGSYAYG